MKVRMGKKRIRSLAGKTLFCMAAVTLAVLMAVSAFLFFWFREQMLRENRELTRGTLSNADLAFQYYIKNARDTLSQWFNSSEGTLARLDDDYDMMEHVGMLDSVLDTMANIPYMHSVYFINEDREVTFEAIASGIRQTEDLEEILAEKLAGEYVEKGGMIKPFLWNVSSRYDGQENIALLTVYYWERSSADAEFTGAALINIDAETLSRSLFSDLGGDVALYIIDGHGQVVAHNDGVSCGEDWSGSEVVRRILEGEEDFRIVQDGKKKEINWLASSQDGFYVVAESDYMGGSWHISDVANVIFVILFGAAVLIIAVMVPMYRRIFEPFQQMVTSARQNSSSGMSEEMTDEVAFLSSYYGKMEESIRVLRRKEEEGRIVRGILMGNVNGELREALLREGILSRGKPYVMLLALIIEQDGHQYSMQEYDMMRAAVGKRSAASLAGIAKCTCLEISLKKLLFILTDIGPETTADKMEKLLEQANDYPENIRVIAVGERLTEGGGSDYAAEYRRLEECLKTKALLGGSEYQTDNRTRASLKTMTEAVKAKSEAQYLEGMEQLFSECAVLPYTEAVERLAHAASEIMQVKAKAQGQDIAGQKELDLHREIESFTRRSQLEDCFRGLWQESYECLEEINRLSAIDQMAEAVDYIRGNYSDSSLNVNTLALRMHLSTPYFGKLFRQFAGCTVLEYITRTRMEKASELLLTMPDKDINRIAGEVGYSNNAYFATAFKKYFGVSPSKYRDYHITGRG